ncbi:MAG: apolipoprotein N-acyltransferase [Pirellulales bacterium]
MGTAAATTPADSRTAPAPTAARAHAAARWWQSTWALAAAGNVLLWAALPPVGFAPLAWIAPVPWILLVRRNTLAGRRPYGVIWFTSFLCWLAVLHWVTLPHWATSIGWVALCFYLGCYLPVFVGLCRVAVHRLHLSPIVAAPVVWTGLEYARAHLLSGFTMATLATTQYRWPLVLQTSDIFGCYGVSFLMMLVAAGIAQMLPWGERRASWWPAVPVVAALAAALSYGQWRLNEQATRPGPKIALIQGSIDIDMKHDPTQSQRIFDEYIDLSLQAVREHRDLDLMVWPETMFRYPWFTFEDGYVPPADAISMEEAQSRSRRAVANTVKPLGVPLVLGIDTVHGAAAGNELLRYNTALFLEPGGALLGRYDKCHPVMFGEYIPLAKTFPWIYQLTPLVAGVEAGPGPQAVTIGNTCYAANICFEDILPHLIRRQVWELRQRNAEPDVLLNLTNDGWFWGSSELDLHLACALPRAIECRKPLLIAANTGFSAWIDSCGRIRAQGPRRATDVIVANVEIDRRASWYVEHGDVPAGLCLIATLVLAAAGLGGRWQARRAAARASAWNGPRGARRIDTLFPQDYQDSSCRIDFSR